MEILGLGEMHETLVLAISVSAVVVLVTSGIIASSHKVGNLRANRKECDDQSIIHAQEDIGDTGDMPKASEKHAHEFHYEEPDVPKNKHTAPENDNEDQSQLAEEEGSSCLSRLQNNKTHESFGHARSSRGKSNDLYENVILPPPPPYPNGWFYLCHSNTIQRNGGPKYLKAMGLHLAAFRGESGDVHVLDAFCPHLGANMAIGGTVHGECLRCPFHHWEFNGTTGMLESVPYSDDKTKRVSVGSYAVREQDGLILFWVHAEESEPTWFPPVLTTDSGFDSFQNKLLFGNVFLVWLLRVTLEPIAVILRLVLPFGLDNSLQPRDCVTRDRIFCHIQEIPENGSDSAHFNALHSDAKLPVFRNFLTHEWSSKWECSRTNRDKMQPDPDATPEMPWYMAQIELQNSLKILGHKLFRFQGCANQIGPGLVYIHLNFPLGIKVSVIETVTPVAPMSQHVTHSLYSPARVPWLALWILSRLLQEQFLRDKSIWDHKLYLNRPYVIRKVCHRTARRIFEQGGETICDLSVPYVENRDEQDGPILAFRRWYKQFYSPNSEPFESAMRRCEKEIIAAAANLSSSIDSPADSAVPEILQQVIEQKLPVSPSLYDW